MDIQCSQKVADSCGREYETNVPLLHSGIPTMKCCSYTTVSS